MIVPLPHGPFDLVYADPPWKHDFSPTNNRSVENHYSTMGADEIAALPVAGISSENSVLFLWAPSPNLLDALRVMDAWSFSYRTLIVWDKGRIGMGYWARSRHELLLIGTRGTVRSPTESWRPDSILVYPRTNRHSEKPSEVRRLITRMVPWANRRIELFCRGRPSSGWIGWGDQAAEFPGPGRPRRYHFDREEAARLRATNMSWSAILQALNLPPEAKSSVRWALQKASPSDSAPYVQVVSAQEVP